MPRVLPLIALVGACIEYGHEGQLPREGFDNPPAPPAEVVVDEFVQVTTPKADILWVIDNSGSMFDEQEDLVANFPVFMQYFDGSGLDYHIGVTSTDLDNNYNGSKGKLVVVGGIKYIEPNTPSPVEIFTAMATLGTTGSGSEKGMGAAYLALEENRETVNAGFYRDDAALHTIVISDEPDFTSPNMITETEFVDWYQGLKDNPEDRTFSSIISPGVGARYATLSNEIGGIVRDITSEDWPLVLEQLGLQAAGLKKEYFLSQIPVPETIDVRVVTADGAEVPPFVQDESYDYDGNRNSITFFEFIPESLSHVIVTYEAESTGYVVDDLRSPGL